MPNRFKYRIYGYGKANQLGLLTDYLFYAKLKQVNTTGYFKAGSILSSVEKKTKLSRVTISARLKSLIKHDLAQEIINHKTGKRIGIRLRSYRYVYTNIFGLIYNKSELYNITYKDIKDLKAQIVLLEQYAHEKEKIKKDERKVSDSPKSKIQPRLSEISCSHIAHRLGYTNVMTGHRMKELARKKKYIKQNKILKEHGFVSLTTNLKYNITKSEVVKKWIEKGSLPDRRFFTIKKGNKIVLYERCINQYVLKKQSLISQREDKTSKELLLIDQLVKKYADWDWKKYYYFSLKHQGKSEPDKLLTLISKHKLDTLFLCPWSAPFH